MAHMRLYHKETGKYVDVWSVDAKELLASGEYSMDPATGAMEGVPGETVMRPFDPTMHREDPASHPGDMVVTSPEGVAEQPSMHMPSQAPQAPMRQGPQPGEQRAVRAPAAHPAPSADKPDRHDQQHQADHDAADHDKADTHATAEHVVHSSHSPEIQRPHSGGTSAVPRATDAPPESSRRR